MKNQFKCVYTFVNSLVLYKNKSKQTNKKFMVHTNHEGTAGDKFLSNGIKFEVDLENKVCFVE